MFHRLLYTISRALYNRGMMKLLQCHDNEVWDDYVLEHEGHPLQLWGWGQVKAAHGWSVDRLLAYDDEDRVVGAAQLLIRPLPLPLRALGYVPRGPIVGEGNRGEFLELLADYTKRTHRAVTLTIEPDDEEFDTPRGWRKSKNSILPARTIILDLKQSESELLNAMVKKTRQYIRKSAAEAMTIRPVRTREDLEKCMAVYHATSKRAHFALHGDQYYYDVFNQMGDHAYILAAYVDDQPIAFLWLGISAETAYEQYGGMNELGQQLRANYALKWHAILKCKEWGLSRYDFGGLLGDGAGVTTFKKGWTDHETHLAGTFDKPLSSFYGVWNSGLPTAKKIVRKVKSLRK